jgi:hypothetical protein
VVIGFYPFHGLAEHSIRPDRHPRIRWFDAGVGCVLRKIQNEVVRFFGGVKISSVQTGAILRMYLTRYMRELIFISNVFIRVPNIWR